MKLSNALKSLIETKGLGILKSPLAINILSDYNGFEEYQSSKNILKNLIEEGILDKIAFFYDNQLPLGSAADNYLSDLYNKLGFRRDVSIYVLNSIFESLGFQERLVDSPSNLEKDLESEIDRDISKEDNNGSHFEFRGIPITGSVERVCSKMEQLGYKVIDRGDDGILLEGKFAGKDNCSILISGSPYSKQTYSISVFTPAALTWWSIKGDYNNMKSMLEKKYGKATSNTEFFSNPYEEGDGYELTALSSGNAWYTSTYSAKNGEISIMITPDAKLLITYKDKINGDEHDLAESISAEEDI